MARETVEIADFYQDFSGWYDNQRDGAYFQMIEEIEERVVLAFAPRAPARVLDLGCGTGRFVARFAPAGLRITGLDLTASMLDVARRRAGSSAEGLINGDALRLPFADDSFDFIYSLKALPHVPELPTALSEVARVLRPEGRAVLEFYNPRSLRRLFTRGGYYTQWHTVEQADALVKKAGLRVTARFGARILTPVAVLHRFPLLGPALRRAEKALAGTGASTFAGYLILVSEKRSQLTISGHRPA